uniref:PDZ domain-containing protein n=1 Tax=Neolamprologus brichardi TaxID=32507 RepID=A0A3Q4HY11_NEOBR
ANGAQQTLHLQMIELEKDPAAHGLGISLTGNKDGSRARMGVYVAAIDPLGPAADSDGRLLLGDQILSINGEDVRAASQERTKGTCNLVIQKVQPTDDGSKKSSSPSFPMRSFFKISACTAKIPVL